MIEFKCDLGHLVDENTFNLKLEQARNAVTRAQEDDFGGWVDLPVKYDKEEFARIEKAAEKINGETQEMLDRYTVRADEIFDYVTGELK